MQLSGWYECEKWIMDEEDDVGNDFLLSRQQVSMVEINKTKRKEEEGEEERDKRE